MHFIEIEARTFAHSFMKTDLADNESTQNDTKKQSKWMAGWKSAHVCLFSHTNLNKKRSSLQGTLSPIKSNFTNTTIFTVTVPV